MAQKFYDTEKAAEVLGVSVDEVKRMQQDRELYGYRDGADWKFKVNDIDKIVRERSASPPDTPADDESDVLLTEGELGQSDAGASGTVIGMETGDVAGESDLQLAESDIQAAESDVQLGDKSTGDDVGSKVSQFEELDLTLGDDLTLEDGVVGADAQAEAESAGSVVDLSGEDLADDDMVLGGSGAGSDITIGGDSGISLVDPTDSGFSLDQPLDLAGGTDASLELHEDEDLTIAADDDSPADLKTDNDFLLTPLEEVGDEDSESGSQVIALDTDDSVDGVGAARGGGAAAMLGEDFAAQGAIDMDPTASPLGAQGGAMADGITPGQTAATLPEAPYSALDIVSLTVCVLVLIICGLVMFDLARNMWSWDAPYQINSSLMDWILS